MNLNDLIRTSLSNDSNTGEAKKAQEEIYKRAMAGDPQASNIIRSVASSPNLQAQWKAPLIKFPDSPIRSTSNEFVRSTYRDAGPVQGRDPDPIGTAIKNDPLNQQGFVFGNQDDRRAYMANPDKQPGSGKSIYQRLTPQEYGALNLASQAGDAAAKNELRQRVKEGQTYTMDSAAAQALKANATAEAERDYESLRQKAIQDFEQRFAAQPTTNQYIPAGQPVPGKPGSVADGKGGFSYPNSNRSVFDQQGEGWLPGSPQANQALYTRSLQAPTLAERNAATKQLADIAMSGNPEARAMVDKIRGADTKPRSSRPSSGANTPDRGNTAMIRPQTNAFDQYRQNQNISASGSGPRKEPTADEMAAQMDKQNRAKEMAAQAAQQRASNRKAAENQAARDAAARKMGFPNAAAAEKAGAKIGNIGDKLPIGGGGGGRRGGGRGGSGGRSLTAKERNDLADKRADQAARRVDSRGYADSAYRDYNADAAKWGDTPDQRRKRLEDRGLNPDYDGWKDNPQYRKDLEKAQSLGEHNKRGKWADVPTLSDDKNQPSVPATPELNQPSIPQIGPSASAGTGGSGQGDASGALIGWLKKRKLGLV